MHQHFYPNSTVRKSMFRTTLTGLFLAHLDSWSWILCNQFEALTLRSPSYSSTHGLWDELHNLVIIALQLASTALAVAYNKVLETFQQRVLG